MTTNPCPSCVETIAAWADLKIGYPSVAKQIRDHFLPKTPAQELAEQCPETEPVKMIAWMLEREKATVEICDQCYGSGEGVADTVCTKCDGSGGQKPTPTDPAPRYVFGPWFDIAGDSGLSKDTEYEQYPSAEGKRIISGYFGITATIRCAYRIGQSYPHDGGPCPLADGSVRVIGWRDDGVQISTCIASDVDWSRVTRFTPLGEGSGK